MSRLEHFAYVMAARVRGARARCATACVSVSVLNRRDAETTTLVA